MIYWVISTAWVLLIYLIYGQALSALSYDLGVHLGTQLPADIITEIGVAFFLGFAIVDAIVYIPLFLVSLVGFWAMYTWWWVLFSAALGISLYWPIACLATMTFLQNEPTWKLPNEEYRTYSVVLPCISIWATWGLWLMLAEASSYSSSPPVTGATAKSPNAAGLSSPWSWWVIQFPGWALLGFLIASQALTACVSYEYGVYLGTEEPPDQVTPVGAGFLYGFTVADVMASIPLLLLGLIGHWRGEIWANVVLAASLGILMYWALVPWTAVVSARDAAEWKLVHELPYWATIGIVVPWAVTSLWLIAEPVQLNYRRGIVLKEE